MLSSAFWTLKFSKCLDSIWNMYCWNFNKPQKGGRALAYHTVITDKLSPTGTLIRRHRIPLPPPNDEQFYTVENFNVGQEITLYSRTFKITVSIGATWRKNNKILFLQNMTKLNVITLIFLQGCDDFTHNFLRKLGVRINNPEGIPSDPYTGHRKKVC